MAISTNDAIKSILKVWYREGVENLLFRNSPLLQKIGKVRVEGKSQNFAAMYGRGGAVSGDFTKAKANAASVAKNVEFSVTPGQLFSVYTMNSKEVQASLTKRGAYMKVAGNKMFAASEGLRKTLAAALYGSGYGEICKWGSTEAITQAAKEYTLPADAIMKIDVGSLLDVKANVSDSQIKTTLTVTEINGDKVKATATTAVNAGVATDVVCLSGSMDSAGNPILPLGLDAWLPITAKRTGNTWNTHINKVFCGVNRGVAADRLAGAFVDGTGDGKKVDTIQKLLMKARRQGSQADIIVMNDADWLAVSQEIETSNTYFTQTSTKSKKDVVTGVNEIGASFSTNFVENIIDDPYCPKGKFYILDSTAIEFWSYTNTEVTNDGIVANNPGKQNPMDADDKGQSNTPYGLIIDDYLNVQSGEGSIDGPATQVTLQLFGSYAVINPSVCAVGLFADAGANVIGL